MGRAGQLSRHQQLRIGRLVLAARAEGEPWKRLAGRFDRDRAQLRRYAERAQSARCTISALASPSPRMNGSSFHSRASAGAPAQASMTR